MDAGNIAFIDSAQRQKNADAILNSIQPDQQDFNVMLIAFSDIIQSKFYDFVRAQAASQAELRKSEQRMDAMIHQILEGFDKSTLNNAEDMVVLASCMIEAIGRAMDRQHDNGLSIKPDLTKKETDQTLSRRDVKSSKRPAPKGPRRV